MASVNVRYIVRDVEASLRFYRDLLGFALEQHPGPGFASVTHGELRLLFVIETRSRWISAGLCSGCLINLTAPKS